MTENKSYLTYAKNIVLLIAALFTLFPVVWVIISAFKPQSELFRVPMSLFPEEWTFANFYFRFQARQILSFISQIRFLSLSATLLTVVINIMPGMPWAKATSPRAGHHIRHHDCDPHGSSAGHHDSNISPAQGSGSPGIHCGESSFLLPQP